MAAAIARARAIAVNAILGPGALLLFTVLAAGCGEPRTTIRDAERGVTLTRENDPEMRSASTQARATLSQFLRLVSSPDSTVRGVAVQVRVVDGRHAEHLWLADPSFHGGLLHGVLANRPLDLTHVSLGDTLRADTASVTDWMAVRSGVLVGGFTLRVLRQRLPPAERAREDSARGYVVDSVTH